MPFSTEVIIQLFQWNWDSIANECKNFIGPGGKSARHPPPRLHSPSRLLRSTRPTGYGYVQVNPAVEHIQGSQWWTDYQVVSYKLQSKRGNRDQYQNMVNACHDAGVKVIAGMSGQIYISRLMVNLPTLQISFSTIWPVRIVVPESEDPVRSYKDLDSLIVSDGPRSQALRTMITPESTNIKTSTTVALLATIFKTSAIALKSRTVNSPTLPSSSPCETPLGPYP